MTLIRQYGEPVLRRWKVIVAVLVISVIGTAVWTMTKGQTSWTATTALTTQSQTRAPEQDAVLSLGYVDYFNQPTYQQVLRAEATIPSGVTLKAETGAASPIMYIEAVSSSPDVARSAAQAAADAFRTDIGDGLAAERQREIADLQKAVDTAVAEVQKPETTDAERNVILDQIRALQGRIADIAADATNDLKTLQTEPGLASSVPSPALAIAGGAFGGLVLGVLIALVLAMLDGRIRTVRDARNAGATVLGEFTAADDGATRARLVEHMVNGLRVRGSRLPSAIAVVGVGVGYGTRLAAELVAVAPPRSRAVLVHADLRRRGEIGPGLVDVLDGVMSLEDALIEGPSGLQVLQAGDLQGRDPYQVTDPNRMTELVAELAGRASLTVFDAAPLQTAPETQIVCASVDSVILVVRRGITRRQQLRVAQELLAAVDAPLAGVVIDVTPPRPGEALEPDRDLPPSDDVSPPAETAPAEADAAAEADAPAKTAPAELDADAKERIAVAADAHATITAGEGVVEDDLLPVAASEAMPVKVPGPTGPAYDHRKGAAEPPLRRPSPRPRRPSVLASSTSNGQHPDGE